MLEKHKRTKTQKPNGTLNHLSPTKFLYTHMPGGIM